VLGTYSANLALPAAQREELFRRIAERIEARPGGRVTKHYLATLVVARLASRGKWRVPRVPPRGTRV
jgi:hypothetical protein